MKGLLLGFLRAMKLPIKLLKRLFRKGKKRNELEEKCRKHVQDFGSTHYS